MKRQMYITKRESEVLSYLGEGKTGEIAKK